MDPRRLWFLLRIILVFAGLFILFFSGLFPVEDYLAEVPSEQLTASVVAADVATLTNQNREQNGLAPLSVNALLTQAAQLKADDMAANSYYAHVSPDGKSPLYWFQLVGYKYLNAGENLVIDRDTSEQAVDAWMHSPAHRENILRPQFTEIGIGVAQGSYKGQDTIYVVQEFGTPYPLAVATPKPVPAVAATPKPAVKTPAPAPLKPATPVQPTNPAPPAASSPARTTVTPELTVAPLPRTSIVTSVNRAAAPFVHALEPTLKKALTPLSLPKPSATSSAVVTGSSTVATSSFAYALPPEFFAPVTYATLASSSIQRPAGQGARTASLVGPALPADQIARPKLLSSFLPAVRSAWTQITLSLKHLLP